MASYHMQINTGGKGAALEHAQYIDRDGRFTEERYGEVEARGHANMPAWAREDTTEFWRASDEFERANGNTYREYELALPRELSPDARVALVQRFAEQEFGTTRPYQWAIHNSMASDGKEQPHVHLMFSDRQHDGIERGPEQFFKRYNAKNPERGGARKMSYGVDKEEAARTYEGIRERWAKVQNLALEQAGVEVRVDHRSLAAQGISREPGVHRGPAVSGIEGRGEVSEVGERQREQMRARTQARAVVIEQVRVVTREELAAERLAVRERRELGREVTGNDRALVLPLVEADRREQLGRAQAAAERRVERRQGLGIGEFRDKLVAQARALRERIGKEIGRVKEWVIEHFPEPLKQLKTRTREVLGEALEKVRGRRPAPAQAPEKEPDRVRTGDKKRGLFDGLKFRSERSPAVPKERDVASSERSSVQPKPAPDIARGQAADEQSAARRRWQAEREIEQEGRPPALNLEEIKAQGRAEAQALRAKLAQEQSRTPSPGRTPEQSVQSPSHSPANKTSLPKSAEPEKFDLEQIKAQGRAALKGVKQELHAEQARAAKALEQKQSREKGGRGRSLGLGRSPGDDDGPRRGPGNDDGRTPRRGRGLGR
jgi:hypothetical protein